MNALKRHIAVVAGGDSSEYHVSLRSAEAIMNFLTLPPANRYIATLVTLRKGAWLAHEGRGKRGESGEQAFPIDRNDFSYTNTEGQHVTFDFAYITIHGTPGENGLLQGYFDLIGMPYSSSSVLVEALTFNKHALNEYMRSTGLVAVAPSLLIRRSEPIPPPASIVAALGLPCFVKPNAGGSSFGVTKVKTMEALPEAIDKALGEGDEVLVEQFVAGMEVTCGCYRPCGADATPQTFPLTEVEPSEEFFDYDAKYNGKAEEITPARVPDEVASKVQQITREIYRRLGCFGLIRVDYILSGSAESPTINLLEVNTTPGMTATSFIPQQVRAAGLDMGEVLADIISQRIGQ